MYTRCELIGKLGEFVTLGIQCRLDFAEFIPLPIILDHLEPERDENRHKQQADDPILQTKSVVHELSFAS